jgi:phospholipid-binding lipoprotein MlaA
MNAARALPLLLLASAIFLALPAHAGQTVAGSAPAQPPAASDAPPVPPTTSGDELHGTEAEDDFAALYGIGNDDKPRSQPDPWEPYNRRVHRFNTAVDRSVARPLATTYVKVVPQFARTGVRNFFSNLRSPVTLVNQALQGRGDDAWDTLGRFLINTTVGIGGLFDPASADQVPKRSEDFGQTLGVWGWKNSRYVELPFFGPRTVRDVVGMGGDMPLSPLRTVDNDVTRIGLQGLQLVDTRVQLMAVDALRDSALDEYAMTRDAWLQRRSFQIEQDKRGGNEEFPIVPVDAMPMPDWGN